MKDKSKLIPRSKIWIEKNGFLVFGDGRMELFRVVDEKGSINKAASKLNISYRHAWAYIKASERRLGIKLLKTQTGGRYGGGARLTDQGRALVVKYEKFRKGINEMVDNRFKKVFGPK
jgi:molybdate transport system regulatory protein